jgi:large subunit ribosomal protein L25
MAQHAQLKAERRELLGKGVRRLRHEGILPATVYGYNTKPVSIQVNAHDFASVLRHAGRTGLIDLTIGTERARPVFVKQTTVDAKRNVIQHVEFYQANLRERMTSEVPLHFVGDSPAVREGGILLPLLDHVSIESLPDDVPANGIEVDVSGIVEINGAVHAREISLPGGVTLVTPGDDIVVKVNPPIAEEVVEEVIEEATPLPEELGGEETQPDAVPEA